MTAPLRAALIVLLLASPVGLGPELARAAESVDSPEVAAEKLHKRALDAFKQGDRAGAISLWLSANDFHPFWKYSYNLANTYYLEKDYLTAWRFLLEAKQTMKEHLDKLGTLEASLAVELDKTHAYLEIQVLPPDAVVLKDGEPWLPPRSLWTTAARVRFDIAAPDHEPQTKEVELAPGKRVVETFALLPKQRGTLVVTGTPQGASVAVRPLQPDGAPVQTPPVTIGQLPQASVKLPPGVYEVTVEDVDHVPRVANVEVLDGAEALLAVALRKRPPPSRGLDGKQVAGLVTGGLGVVASIIGGVLLASADGTADEIARLNADADRLRDLGDYEGYLDAYDDLVSDKDSAELGGWIAIGAGAAALVTGVVLVVTGGEAGPPETKGTVDLKVGLGPGGAGVLVGVGF